MAFRIWHLHNAPHAKLHAYNLPIFSDGQTLGAADFVVSLNQQPYHIELACKYYGGDQVQNLRGLNPKDMLTDKAAKLVQQSKLLHTPQGKATLTAQGLPENLLPASIVRGIGFFNRRNGERLMRRMQSLFGRANTQTEDIDILRGFFNTVSHRIHKKD